MQSTKAYHGVLHVRISTGQQPQQDNAIFDYPAQLRNNHNAFCARVHACLQDDSAPRSIADEGIEMFEVSKRFPYTPRRFQWKTVALANRQEPQPFHHAPRTRHRNLQTKSAPKSKPRPSTCQQESPHPGRFRQGEPGGSRVPRPPAANELLPKKEGVCTLSVAKVQNGISPEAHVAPNSVQKEKVRSYRAIYRSWINTVECVGQ